MTSYPTPPKIEELTFENIINATKEIDNGNNYFKSNAPSQYDIIINNKPYHPKTLIQFAYLDKFPEENHISFDHGKNSDAYKLFEKLEIEIDEAKQNRFSQLLINYHKYLQESELKDELYKWEIIEKNKNKPELDSSNFTDEYLSLDLSNLVYKMAKAVGIDLAKNKPKEFKVIFKILFDESIELSQRIEKVTAEIRKLYRGLRGKKWELQHHHDERTLSVYLTFKFPNKYTFYQNEYYKNYCEYFGIKKAKVRERYPHYLKLIKEIASKIKANEPIIESFSSLIPNRYNFDNEYFLVAQDFMFYFFNKKGAIKLINGESILKTQEMEKIKTETESMKTPLNQILYGPPGTGKTYKLKHHYFEKFTTRESNLSKEQLFNEAAEGLSWWRAIALALIELGEVKVRDIQDNRWVKHKARNSNSQDENATVWNTLQSHAVLDSKTVNVSSKQAPHIFEKNKESFWSINEKALSEQVPQLKEILESVNNSKPSPDKLIKRYVFTTFHQAFTYEDFIEGIKPVLENETKGDLHYEIKDGVFKQICKRAEKDLENDYAIFIDEINRGNVASIFGELITLIEEDKRAGNKEALEVTLPYSKQKFSVPNNLYIIGTMNTADRSVEALDSALRRRFSFEEMMPNYEVIESVLGVKNDWEGFQISEILKTINQRIEVLIDRDHTIGHSYFLSLKDSKHFDEDLKSIFRDKVIPLLQEYFFNDYGKIQLVLGEGFVEKVEYGKNLFPEIKGNEIELNDYQDQPNYRFKIDDQGFDIKEAIGILLNGKKEDKSAQKIKDAE